MKKIILFLLVLNILHAAAQPTRDLADEAKYKFAGRWVGVSGSDSITIHLIQTTSEMEKVTPPGPVDTIAFLYGWHQISQKNVIVESTLDSQAVDLSKGFSVIATYKKNQNRLGVGLRDLTRNMLLDGDFVLLNDNEAVLKTKMKETWRNDNNQYPEGQTFPKEVRLIRLPTAGKSL